MTMTLPILPTTAPQRAEKTAVKTDSSVFVIDEDLAVWRCDPVTGELDQVELPEDVEPVDICVGPGGLLHVLADDDAGALIYRATDKLASDWEQLEVAASLRRIACGPDGRIWAIDEARAVWVRCPEDGALERRAEDDFADEVSVGGDGRVWVISTEERYSGRVIKWMDEPRGGGWVEMPAPSAAVKLAASPEGVAWSVNSMGAIWRLHPLGSGNFSECQVDIDCDKCLFGGRRDFAKDIAVDGSGTVWFLGVNYTEGGYQLMRMANQATRHFQKLPDFGGIRLAAG